MTDLIRRIEAALPDRLPSRIGVAVSGGSDSTALLLLLHDVAAARGGDLRCVTVDHGLRPDSASEAAGVTELCSRIGVPHQTLEWNGWDGSGNVQEAARRARYTLMAEWARKNEIRQVALGHTQDDQAETVVMQLARGAGIDGLAAMPASQKRFRVTWLRPLLDFSRADLRAHLQQRGVSWVDDPSNEDKRFERIRVRDALRVLEPLGVGRGALAQVARNMQAARSAILHQTRKAAEEMVAIEAGSVRLPRTGFEALPDDIARRLLVAGVRWIAGGDYAPRGRSVSAAMEALRRSGSATLEGCRLLRNQNDIWVFREHGAVRALHAPIDTTWDNRWRLEGPAKEGLSIAALGASGLATCPEWRDTGLPRALLEATPAVWRGDELIAAPLAGRSNGWTARLEKGESSFFERLISH